jgi:predicted  nucleic acid-binding Zn-ribbon protein
MNQYYYEKALYDKKVQDINAKIEIIQTQDKNLELKLKQLDTEQNAISTEIDAVKKVISKNVESSFKTFNA